MATEQQTSDAAAGDAGTGTESLTVTDNRTGKTYELPIEDGTVRGMDLRQIKVNEDDFGMMSYDPAFTNTASCRSSITYIDGDAGILEHRGYSIEQLCEKLDLPRGRLPADLRRAADRAAARPLDLRHHPPHLRPRGPEAVLRGLPLRRPPDGDAAGRRRRPLDLLPGREADRRPRRALHGGDPADRQGADPRRLLLPAQHGLPLRLPGQRPQLRRELPLDDVQEDRSQARARSRRSRRRSTSSSSSTPTTNRTARPTRCAASAPPTSTPTRRSRPGVAALYGPLHGGANEAVLRMLRRIESVDNIPDFLERVKNREEKLMGFGHRVYKNYDPRARIIQQHMDEVFEATEYNPLVEIARELEKRALDDEYFTSRKLYPNVDFYSGIIYEALEIPTDMFTVIFAIPRTAGWIAQWMEMNEDPEQKIARPRQIYTGERERDYVPIDDREGPEKIVGPPARRPKRPRRGA